jgi:Protein of unknown function (DUF3179)
LSTMTPMNQSKHTRLSKSRVALAALAALAVGAVVVLAAYWAERAAAKWPGAGPIIPSTGLELNRRFQMKGIVRPPTVPADRAELREDDEVIGVMVDGKARAYQLKALYVGRHHVVNDLIDNVPISVAYCNISDCVHVYTRSGTTEPLDVWQSGFGIGGLILKIEGVAYRHQSGEPLEPGPDVPPIPYQNYPWVRTIWREWKQQHPGTDVYTLAGPTARTG